MNNRCPSLETLLDLTLGDLPEEEAFAVREHLLDCQVCLAQAKDLLEEPDEPAPGFEPVSAAEEDAAWSSFEEALTEEGLRPASSSKVLPFRRLTRSPGFRVAVAAGFAATSFGLGLLVRPEPPTMTVTTSARTFAEGRLPTRTTRPDRPTRVSCAAEGQTMTWILSVPRLIDREPDLLLTLGLWKQGGEKLELLVEQKSDENGNLLLTIPPERISDGVYVVEIHIPDDPKPELFYFDVRCDVGP